MLGNSKFLDISGVTINVKFIFFIIIRDYNIVTIFKFVLRSFIKKNKNQLTFCLKREIFG